MTVMIEKAQEELNLSLKQLKSIFIYLVVTNGNVSRQHTRGNAG